MLSARCCGLGSGRSRANYCAERANPSQKALVSHAALAGAATVVRTDNAISADAMVFMSELLSWRMNNNIAGIRRPTDTGTSSPTSLHTFGGGAQSPTDVYLDRAQVSAIGKGQSPARLSRMRLGSHRLRH